MHITNLLAGEWCGFDSNNREVSPFRVSFKDMKSHKTIGILGGGQLGRMLTLAAVPLGFDVVVLHPHAESPASLVGAQEIVADFYNEAAIKELAERSDYLTIEIEHVSAQALELIEKTGKPVNPAPKDIRIIQDKYTQKEFLQSNGIKVASFTKIDTPETAIQALKNYGGKMLLKTRYGAYDGRGNKVIGSEDELSKAIEFFGSAELYAEQFIPFEKELAVMVARDFDGTITTYPVVETIHQRNICVEVIAPAQVDEAVARLAESTVRAIANLMHGAGVFGIELFLTKEGNILVNEIAPRVHNSGHYTIEACRTSQFEQHIRAISGLHLGTPDLVVPAAVMVNILGEREGPVELSGVNKVLAHPATSLHIYGKSPTKIDRKMGHITTTGVDVQIVKDHAEQARKELTI